MSEIFDLFGDPVPEGWGKRGRPQHVATAANRNKVNMLLALGWNNERIARALSITPPTLRKNYFRELKFRDEARTAMLFWTQFEGGSSAAGKAFRKFVEQNDLMLYGQTSRPQAEEKAPKLGKKEQALVDARQPDTGSTLGDLMARRQGTSH
ncbi:MAG: hypothetical protein E5V72_17010 [Mesorhizobium sp.]|nr:MAG: hypothetical protein E5V72_17010 [Mesorhizobium sp.]